MDCTCISVVCIVTWEPDKMRVSCHQGQARQGGARFFFACLWVFRPLKPERRLCPYMIQVQQSGFRTLIFYVLQHHQNPPDQVCLCSCFVSKACVRCEFLCLHPSPMSRLDLNCCCASSLIHMQAPGHLTVWHTYLMAIHEYRTTHQDSANHKRQRQSEFLITI